MTTLRRSAIVAGIVAFLAVRAGAPAHAEETAAAEDEKSFTWDLRLAGWEGLRYELRQRAEIGGPDRLIPQFEERVGLKGRFGSKLAIDGDAFSTSGGLSDIANGVEVRRARLYTVGEIHLVIPVLYKIEISVIGNEFVLEQNYLAFKGIPVLQTLTAGNIQPPFSLEDIMSSRDLTFMEAAAPTQAFAPGITAGVLVGGPVLDQRVTWGFGFFSGDSNIQLGNRSGLATAIGRVTWLPVDREGDGPRELVHLGVSGSVSIASQQPVRYRARPEAHLAPFIVDTGDIHANNAYQFDVEAATVRGPFSLQSEFFLSVVDDKRGGSLTFGGAYVYGSWLITGESRPYDRTTGVFSRLRPKRELSLTGGGFGAVELGARYSHVDLNDGPVRGGIMDLGTLGLTWYWNPYLKMKVNYVTGGVSGSNRNGRLHIFETRLELDF